MNKFKFTYLIIGGGIIGSAIAYSLSNRVVKDNSNVSIALLDIDLEGSFSSTLKNAGGVRATWRNDANIQLCSYSIDFYEKISEKIDFKQEGYYWLHNIKSWEEINNNYQKYLDYGIDIELYEKTDVAKHLPFVDNLDGVSGLSISRKSGLLDHYSLREYYRKGARKNGVEFIDRQFVAGAEKNGGKLTSLMTKDLSANIKNEGEECIRKVLKYGKEFDSYDNLFDCEVLINAGGAWAPQISKHYGFIDNDIRPRRRQIELISCPDLDLSAFGMIIDTSDIYFHREGDLILVGYSNPDEPYGVNFRFDNYGLDENSPFIEQIWKPLWNRISKFERLKFIRGWAGIYGETPDKSGYMGKVEGLDNVYECAGHTGRGIMISYGLAEAFSDMLIGGNIRDELKHASDFQRNRPSGKLLEQLHL